ncbi:ABC transporter OS=Lysinibacillus sphaericus OX=1421 GN=LYSIN_01899 PE=4 SV=1 [Lysinibacillus sphaericus]
MNIFLKELKSHRKSLIFWSIGVFLMVASGMTKYEAYSSSGQSINKLMADMPKSLRAVLGFNDLDLTKASGYYGMLFLYLVLMATIHAVMLGATIIAKEERDKTSEFLFVKPVSRSKSYYSQAIGCVDKYCDLQSRNIRFVYYSFREIQRWRSGE